MPTSASFRIRRAGARDVETLARFRLLISQELQHREAVPLTPAARRSFRDLQTWIRGKMRERRLAGFLAVDSRGTAIAGGFVWLMEVPPRPDLPGRYLSKIQAMSTLPEWRKRGAASAVLAATVRWARSRGCERILLRASTMGEKLYAAHGFARVAEMQRELSPPKIRPGRSRRRK